MTAEVISRCLDDVDSKKFVDKVYQIEDMASMRKELIEFGDIGTIQFLTGNKNKVDELNQSINLQHIKVSCSVSHLDLPEIQDSDVLAIVQDKCERAFDNINRQQSSGDSDRPIVTLVEDTCLNFNALGGMPGPYVKWFLEAIGPMGLNRMLAGFEDKSAEAICIYALMPTRRRILFFRGSARGQIVEPRGTIGWGWDPIFEEERSRITFGEMDAVSKSKFSHRANAIEVLKKFLGTTQNKFDDDDQDHDVDERTR